MKVRLVSVTEPDVSMFAGSTDWTLKAEHLIVYCARVSNPSNQENFDTAPKLLKYLIDHRHWSPFEMADMTVEIETSRAIAAQILRHRSFSFQEFSQRYADPTQMGFEEVIPRRQDDKNRQNSTDDLPSLVKRQFLEDLKWVQENAHAAYQLALENGVAKESARFLLPLNTTTRLYMKGSVRSWIHYLQARLDPSTQIEHREVAQQIQTFFALQFPNVAEALWGPVPTLGTKEVEVKPKIVGWDADGREVES